MNNKVVGFSSVNEDELMNVDGGLVMTATVITACLVWGFNAGMAGACTYLAYKMSKRK